MVKVYREEIVDHGNYELFEVETWGELKFMPRNARIVFAIFGSFERTPDSTLLYTASVIRDPGETDRELLDQYDSMYLDDLRCLREGRIEIIE